MKYLAVFQDGVKIDETTSELYNSYLSNFLRRNEIKHWSVFGRDVNYSDCQKQNERGTCLYNHSLEFKPV